MIVNVILRLAAAVIVVAAAVAAARAETSVDRQKQYLEDSLRINVAEDHRSAISRQVTNLDYTWRDWQTRTGELPPDFAQMRSQVFLPDPLERVGAVGEKVANQEQWQEKREWIRGELMHWVMGTVPPAPENLEAVVLNDRTENDVRVQMIELRFGPEKKARMTFELMIPEGTERRPVYMTQWNHRAWAQLAVQRGYIGCVYAGADSKDDAQAYQALYSDYDFTGLMRRAWGASRIVDYLVTRPEVNKEQIAITGHSRNGKQSLWAAAFDERFTAVVTSSCGTGGMTPWRYSDPEYCNQTLDDITANAAHWFHPRLRFFFGREDRLPVDQNLMLSLIAPRGLLMHYSTVERQLNPWANEKCFESVKTVYDWLGAGDKIGLYPRMGEHAVAARDLERCIDFLDIQFGRSKEKWANRRTFDFSYEEWVKSQSAEITSGALTQPVVKVRASYTTTSELAEDVASMREGVQWLLGEAPPRVKPLQISEASPGNVDWIEQIIGRPELRKAKVMKIGSYGSMGNHVAGNLYYPVNDNGTTRTGSNGQVPVIIYLHQYSYAHGYALGYSPSGGRGNTRLFQKLVDAGFAVLAFDMYGFGTRQEEAASFYKRWPQWSKLGKMVDDVTACVDAVEMLEFLDEKRVFVLGNTIGGSVGLLAAVQDERIAGVAAVAAFTPWRSSDSQYKAVLRFSHEHGFAPRLGLFAGEPQTVPVDYGEIMAGIAPRPLMVIAPELDRHSDSDAVAELMKPVEAIYGLFGEAGNLRFETPREINRITDPMTEQVIEFFQKY